MARRNRPVQLVLAISGVIAAGPAAGDAALSPVPPNLLCVTEGSLGGLPRQRLAVSVPKFRAVLGMPSRQEIAADLTYLGPTDTSARLGSGALRQQFGLKLHAANGCNVIYAMWRFAPQPELVVQVKSNPGLSASRACGNQGYRTIRPEHAAPIAAPEIGRSYRLAARLDRDALRVSLDGKAVWAGRLGPSALAFDGPVGLRSDNVRLELALSAGFTGNAGAPVCPSGSEPEP